MKLFKTENLVEAVSNVYVIVHVLCKIIYIGIRNNGGPYVTVHSLVSSKPHLQAGYGIGYGTKYNPVE